MHVLNVWKPVNFIEFLFTGKKRRLHPFSLIRVPGAKAQTLLHTLTFPWVDH